MRLKSSFVTLASVVAVSGCMTDMSSFDAGALGPGECVDDRDCPDSILFFCDTQTSKCRSACRTAEQCNSRPPQFALAECAAPLGCVCDQGECFPTQCTTDAECAGAACRNGACVAPPSANEVARCAVTPDFVIVGADQPLTFAVSMWDAAGEPIVVSAGATWTALGASVSGAPPNGNEANFTARGPASSTADAVRASVGSVQCDARVQVLPDPAAVNGSIISVVDERTGRAIAGALVVLSSTSGAQLQTAVTNESGWVELADVATKNVSVFHSEFSYQTLVAVPDAAVLRVELERNPLDRLGGYSVTLDSPQTSNMHLARVGLSSSTDLTALALTDDFEPTVPTDFVIGSAINQQDMPVPLGTFIGFGEQRIKNVASVFGVNGVCRDGDEAGVLSGTCGAQSSWVISADLPFGDFPLDLAASGTMSFLRFLGRSGGFSHYQSSLERDVQFPLRAPPAGGVGDVNDRSGFVQTARPFSQLRLGLSGVIKVPKVIEHGGVPIGDLVTTSVALQPGRGLVPLGIGYGANRSPADERIDSSSPLASGYVRLRAAAPHHGFEAANTAVLSQLVSNAWFSDPTAGRANSTVVTRLLPGGLTFDELGSRVVDQSPQSFPALVENAKWNPQPVVSRMIQPRSFSVAPQAGVTVVKVIVRDGLGARWDVLVDAAAPSFTLPSVPGAMRDRLFDLGLASGKPSALELQALRFAEPVFSDRQVGFAEWAGSPALRDQLRHLTAWSRLEVRRLAIAIVTPRPNGVLADDRMIQLAVEGTVLAPNGVRAQVRFKNGAGCVAQIVSDLSVAVPPSCHGQNITLEAELLDESLQPFSPGVQASISGVRIP